MRLSKEEARLVQSLQTKKGRDNAGLFLAEGSKIVAEILESPLSVKTIYHSRPLPDAWNTDNIGVKQTDQDQLQRLSALTTAQDVIATVAIPDFEENESQTGWTLALDGIQNPGNLGALLRLADWFGITGIVASEDTADVYNPKVIQGSMGSFLRVHVRYTDLDAWLGRQQKPVYGAILDGEDIRRVSTQNGTGVLLIGNEGQGIRTPLIKHISKGITIARKGKAESLNAAVAAGILLQHLAG